jgi:L-glutamine:2-deoxy-scyllo-inosose/3-amino-2,3-dideoxy-scyllo-inosose aminotransferase
MNAGAVPVIVDIDPNNYCMDPKAAAKAITPKTRAIIPVHLASNMADMDAIMVLASKHNLVVIEDCAHAHGAKWNGRGAGTIGDFGSFSLQSSKTLTAGEGGILLCRTEAMARKAMAVIDCGRGHAGEGGREAGPSPLMGGNFRLSELQAALALVGIQRFPAQAREREQMAAYMDEALSEVTGVHVLPRDPRHTTRSFYMYIFSIEPAVFGVEHDLCCAALEAEGIPAETGYEAMHHYSLFQPGNSRLAIPNAFPERFDFDRMNFPVAEKAAEHEAIWLEESVFRASPKGVDDVIRALKKVQKNARELNQAAQAWKSQQK